MPLPLRCPRRLSHDSGANPMWNPAMVSALRPLPARYRRAPSPLVDASCCSKKAMATRLAS